MKYNSTNPIRIIRPGNMNSHHGQCLA